MSRWPEVHVEDPGRPSPGFLRLARRVLAPVVRLCHRPTLEGVENLPTSTPYLLVANHSAGLALAEIFSFIVLYLEEVGPERPIAGFAHPLAFHLFPASTVLKNAGAIPSTYAAAEAALAARVPILVFPGGDHESMRPIWQAHRVDFGGRKGFLRIARKTGVPIVPMGIRGSHFSAPILWRSRALATLLVAPRLAGLKRWAITLFGAAVALGFALVESWPWHYRALAAFAWLGSPFIFIAWIPATIRMRIGSPIAPDDLFTPAEGPPEPEDAMLGRALVRVEREIQRLVDQ